MIQNIQSKSFFQTDPGSERVVLKNDTSLEDFQALLLKQIYLKSLFESGWESDSEEESEEEDQSTMINPKSNEESNEILMEALSKKLSKEDVFRLQKYFEERHPKVPL